MTSVHSGNQHARQELNDSDDRSSALFFGTTVLLVAVLLVAGFFMVILPAFKRGRTAQTSMEMLQLELALESYITEFGSIPPGAELARIQQHIDDAMSQVFNAGAIDGKLPHAISDLDEREILPLWLSGTAWDALTMQGDGRNTFFEFTESRLFDEDGDGWLEYVNIDKNYFILRDGEILILDRETGSTKSFEDLQTGNTAWQDNHEAGG